MSPPRVSVVTATFRRPTEVARLLASLNTECDALLNAVIVDNGNDTGLDLVADRAPIPTRVIKPERNLGCGGGVARGLTEALKDPSVTHLWIFDDDAVATPGALNALLAALQSTKADAAVPLVSDANGRVAWFPGPLSSPAWNIIRRSPTVGEFREKCGEAPLAWYWAPWPSLMITRRVITTVGLPRDDYWFQGEDLEWTLRITSRFRGVLAPAAECRHFPPPGSTERVRLKYLAMLQNNAFTATRLPHGRRLARHAPGNAWRFMRAEDFSPRAFVELLGAHWRGAVRGLPAGAPGGNSLQRAWTRLR
jgi:GT2 family glycosyltransferase